MVDQTHILSQWRINTASTVDQTHILSQWRISAAHSGGQGVILEHRWIAVACRS
jgi:hypothetical protein